MTASPAGPPGGRRLFKGAVSQSLPLAFVISSLFALTLIPTIEARIVAGYHARLKEEVQPGRRLLGRMQVALALGRSALRDYLATGDRRHLERYRQSVAYATSVHPGMRALAAEMGAPVEVAFAALASAQRRWQDQAAAVLELRAADVLAARQRLVDTGAYEKTITAAAQLDEAISRRADVLLERSAAAERTFAQVTLVLGGLALLSAFVMVRLARELRQRAAEAAERRLEVEQALEAKAQLVRGITHDLKNPLGAIDGYAQLLEGADDPPLSPSHLNYVARLREAAASMMEIIERMLDLARAEGALQIVRRRVDPARLVRAVVGQYKPMFEAAGVRVAIHTGAFAKGIRTDPARAREVLGNLLSNAAKYTPAGGQVEVGMARVDSGGPRAGRWLAIAVRDTGPGIPPEQMSRVFEEFTRGDHAHVPGAGLGLAIARRIARMLGGEVTMDTAVGEGSTFTFWLPR